jgi:hypothetical protein
MKEGKGIVANKLEPTGEKLRGEPNENRNDQRF